MRGFRVFPLAEDSKFPLVGSRWTVDATDDPLTVWEAWTDPLTGAERDCNVGFLTTGWVVVDIDAKNGKPGLESHARLGMDWDTLTVRTPTGGYHQVYCGESGQSPLADGIDVRSHHGYVVAPGSTIGGVPYVVELDLPVADFPAHLRHLLRPPRERSQAPVVASVDLDTPEVVEIAAHWLSREARPAVEGQSGDLTTFQVACRVRDYGLSEDAACELMLDEYNPRCEPPWEPGELRGKVGNAYRYATGAPGSAAPAAVFEAVRTVLPPTFVPATVPPPEGVYQFGNTRRIDAMSERPWVVDRLLMSGIVTLLVGAGGAGKSMLGLTVAAHLAVGRDFLGYHVRRAGRVIVYDAEDDLDEMSKRLHAICAVYGLPLDEVSASISLNSDDLLYGFRGEEETTPGLRVAEGRPLQRNAAQLAELVAAARDPEVVAVVVGPIVNMHTGKENDPGEIQVVMGALRSIARQADVAVLAVHHTGKPPLAASSAWAGDMNAGRGSSAFAASARIVLTLFTASAEDCEDAGIAVAERRRYVRLDGAKGNNMEAPTESRWLRWQGVALPTGDSVGVLVAHDARRAASAQAQALATVLHDRMVREGGASLDVAAAVGVLRDTDPSLAREDQRVVRSRLERMLAEPVRLEDCTIRLLHGSGKAGIVVVME